MKNKIWVVYTDGYVSAAKDYPHGYNIYDEPDALVIHSICDSELLARRIAMDAGRSFKVKSFWLRELKNEVEDGDAPREN